MASILSWAEPESVWPTAYHERADTLTDRVVGVGWLTENAVKVAEAPLAEMVPAPDDERDHWNSSS